MEGNTMFRMVSNTEPAIAINILAQERKLSCDDPVLIGAEGLPGTSHSYSNPGFNMLGALVEIASGQSLESFPDQRIYTPLGMNDSYNHEVASKLDGKLSRMGVVYDQRDTASGEWIPGWQPGDPPQVPFVRASGGMISTAMNYAIFCQMSLNGGAQDPERGVRVGYGMGWMVARDGTFSHTGSDGTGAWVDPSEHLIVLVFTQTPRGRNPRDKFLELVRASILN